MTKASRAKLAKAANEAAALSRSAGAPVLSASSSREVVIRWLQWNDPNGSHTDALAEREDICPYDEEGAWGALACMLADV